MIIHETFEAIRKTERMLRSFGVINTFHIIPNPLTIVTFDLFGNRQADMPPREASLAIAGDRFPDLAGYRYKVHRSAMEPYASIDMTLTREITRHQNASVEFTVGVGGIKEVHFAFNAGDGSADFSIYKVLLDADSSNERVFLPQWEHLCAIVPRRHWRPLMVQLVKPFCVEVWIFLAFYVAIRGTRGRSRFLNHDLALVMFLIADFCLMESYLAKAMCFLINMRYDPDPKTMAELDRRGETFVLLRTEMPLLEGYHGLNIIVVKDKLDWHFHQYSIILYCKIAEYLENTDFNFNPDTNDKLATILHERLMRYPAFYTFAKGHPLRHGFEVVLSKLFDAGIWTKIYNKWTSELQQFESFLSGEEKVISFSDMWSLWILLVGGYTISVCCFALEKMRK